MSNLKKIICILLSLITAISLFVFPSGAAKIFDKATVLKPLELVSFKNNTNNAVAIYYKINISQPGTITLHYKDRYDVTYEILNRNGQIISGYLRDSYHFNKKGTYYIKLKFGARYGEFIRFIEDFYYTFSPDDTPVSVMVINLKVGDTIELSSMTDNYDGKVTWKSTKKTIATVDSGKITALKQGKSTIRAYMDNGDYAEIMVKVKSK